VRGERVTNASGRTRKSGGHRGARAQPFFYPAYRALKKRVKSRLSRGASKAAKKIAGRR
jgi:hypothetical protein